MKIQLNESESVYGVIFEKSLNTGVTLVSARELSQYEPLIEYEIDGDSFSEYFDIDTLVRKTAILVIAKDYDEALSKAKELYFDHYGPNEDFKQYLEEHGVILPKEEVRRSD